MFSSIKPQSLYKRGVYVLLSSSFLRAHFNPRHFLNALRRHKRSASQTLACTQTWIFRVENVCNALGHYEQTLSNAIHHTSNVNLLQEKVKPCCDLLKQRTFHLLLLCLPHANSDHITTLSKPTDQYLRCSKSQIPEITIDTERKLRGNVKSQRHKQLQRP
jgi:hypothetical protein